MNLLKLLILFFILISVTNDTFSREKISETRARKINDWKTIRSSISIDEYEDFIKKYKQGIEVDSAKIKLNSLYKTRELEFKNIKIIYVRLYVAHHSIDSRMILGSFDFLYKKFAPGYIQEIFNYTNLKLAPDSTQADAQFVIFSSGEAIVSKTLFYDPMHINPENDLKGLIPPDRRYITEKESSLIKNFSGSIVIQKNNFKFSKKFTLDNNHNYPGLPYSLDLSEEFLFNDCLIFYVTNELLDLLPRIAEYNFRAAGNSDHPHLRFHAYKKLAEYKNPKLINYFIEALLDGRNYAQLLSLSRPRGLGIETEYKIVKRNIYDILRNGLISISELKDSTCVLPLIELLKGHQIRGISVNKASIYGSFIETYVLPIEEKWNVKLRALAAECLGIIGDEKAADALIFALNNDSDEEVKCTVINALGKIKNINIENILIFTLNNDNSEKVKCAAAKILGKMGGMTAKVFLINILDNEGTTSKIKDNAAIGLAFMEEKKGVDYLISKLKEKKDNSTASLILQIGKPAEDYIIPLLNENDEVIIKIATNILGKIKSDKAANPLICLLKNNRKHESVTIHAISNTIKEIGDTLAIRPLISSLYCDANIENSQTEQAIISFGDMAVKSLIDSLQNENWIIRMKSASLLGKLDNNMAIEPLIRILNDKNYSVQHAAFSSLKLITNEDFGLKQKKWKKWLKEQTNN
jgi:HEAT repeat protein